MSFQYLFAKLIKKMHFPAVKDSFVDKTAKICSGAYVTNCTIDRYSYIGNFSTLIHAEIGGFCSISDNCIIGGGSHPLKWVSTSPVFHQGNNCMNINLAEHSYLPYQKTLIGNDVWIGANVLIKGGITIADGAVIGMGSVVTKNVGPYEIWAGNPAKLIRKRFDQQIIEELVSSKWWELDELALRKSAELFNNINEFLRKYPECR